MYFGFERKSELELFCQSYPSRCSELKKQIIIMCKEFPNFSKFLTNSFSDREKAMIIFPTKYSSYQNFLCSNHFFIMHHCTINMTPLLHQQILSCTFSTIFFTLYSTCVSVPYVPDIVMCFPCSHYDTSMVLTAAGITALVTFGLTIFALQTKVSYGPRLKVLMD